MPSRYRLSPTTNHANQPFDGAAPQRNEQSKVDGPKPPKTDTGFGQQLNVTSPMPQSTARNNTTPSNGQDVDRGARSGKGASYFQMGMPGRKPGWALKKQQAIGPAVTRGVRVLCTVDQLVLIPARGERGAPIVVRIEGKMQQTIDPFVAALHQYIDGWGLALAGGYWKPELHVEVAVGGEQHFYLLQKYLKRSGIIVTQRIEAKP